MSKVERTLSMLAPRLLGFAGASAYLAGWEAGRLAKPAEWLALFVVWSVSSLLINSIWQLICRRAQPKARQLRWIAGGLVLAGGWFFWPGRLFPTQPHFFAMVAAALLSLALQRLFVGCVRFSRSFAMEALRWLCVAGAAAYVIHPYATRNLVGGGDIQHYAQQLQDAVEQFEGGVFPIFVGQSAHAFNGDFHPLRTAPYFQYLGLAANLLTGRHLGAAGVVNLLIVGSLVAAAFLTYVLVLRLGGRRFAWHACLLAIAGLSAPGVLSLIYSGDMVASWMALPFFPPLIYGFLRLREARSAAGPLMWVAVSLGAMWLAHAPLAFWSSLLVALGVGEFLLSGPGGRRRLWLVGGAAVVGAALAAYVFVSVSSLEIPNDPNLISYMRHGGMIDSMRTNWSAIFSPVDPAGMDLARNLQLSPVLWLALAVGLAGSLGRRCHAPLWVYVFGLLLLLTPLAITAKIWGLMPSAVLGATDKWPMQRFYPILSMIAPFAAVAGLRAPWLAGSKARWIVLGLLLIGCGYSLNESRKFIRRGKGITLASALTEQRFRPENSGLSRYSYEYFGRLPTYFRTGPINALFQNRLLAPDTLTISDSNQRHLLLAESGQSSTSPILRFEKTEYGGRFAPTFSIEPGHTYLVGFNFGAGVTEGVIEITGPTVQQQYTVSPAMEMRSFSDGSGVPNSFALWTTGKIREEVEMRLHLAAGRSPAAETTVRLIEVDRSKLPLRLESLIPYRLTLSNAGAGWLETPKIFLPGYVAFVDGRKAEVARSPDGLTMVPINPRARQVVLRYEGTAWLRIAFWVTATGWLLVFAVLFLPRAASRWWTAQQERFLRCVGKAAAAAGCLLVPFAATVYAVNRPAGPETLSQADRFTSKLTLPVGRKNATEVIASKQLDGAEVALFARYVSGQQVQFGFLRNGRPWITSNPMPANYIVSHELDVVWAHEDHTQANASPRFTIEVDHRVLIDRLAAVNSPPDARSSQLPPVHRESFSGSIQTARPRTDARSARLGLEFAP